MAAKKAAAARRVAEEIARQEKELNEWLDFCDETETSGKGLCVVLCMNRLPSPDA